MTKKSSEILGDESKKFLEKSKYFVGKCRFSSGQNRNLELCPAPGIQEPRWPRASKNLCTLPEVFKLTSGLWNLIPIKHETNTLNRSLLF